MNKISRDLFSFQKSTESSFRIEIQKVGSNSDQAIGFTGDTEAAATTMMPLGGRPEHIDGEFRDPSRALALLKEIDLKVAEDSLGLMPILLSFLKHDALVVVKQSIASGTSLLCAVLEEMALQLLKSGKVERWLEEMWHWIIKFKDAIYSIGLEPGSAGTKVLAVKFLETCVLLFTCESCDVNNKLSSAEGKGKKFNVSWLVEGHPSLNPALLASEANKALRFLIDMLQSSIDLHGSFIIAVINCLAAIARHRPFHYGCVLSALLDFNPSLETLKGGHAASIRYSVRTSLLGFVKCTHPLMMASRDELLKALRAMNAGEAADRIIRQLEKMSRSTERITDDVRLNKDDSLSGQITPSDDIVWKRPVVQAKDNPTVADSMPAKRTRFDMDVMSAPLAQMASDFVHDDDDDDGDDDDDDGIKASTMDNSSTEVEEMIAMIGALLAQGEKGTESLEILISNIHSDMMADIVIANMKHLSENPLSISGRYGALNASVHYSASPTQVASTEASESNTMEINRDGSSCLC